ncbi:MAG: UbiA family prenyltransferase [Pyrinomonadaceae bacterium]
MELHAIKKISHILKWWGEIFRTVRANEWWEFKLGPALATMYASAFLLRVSIISLMPLVFIVLVALAACAAYVSVVNDFTDRSDDMASGKTNRLVGKSSSFIATVMAFCILSGLAVAFYWVHDGLLLLLYSGSWVAFTLYSLPPIRLKERSSLGVLADACGAHLFPTLLAVAVVYHWTRQPFDLIWLVSIGVWSFSFGIRGILWHQLSDLRYDESISLRTFVRAHKTESLQRLGNFIIFPVELTAFAVMLLHTRCVVAIALLGFYAVINFLRRRLYGSNFCIVEPKPKFHHIVMHEYYEVFFPLAFILASSNQHFVDSFVLVVHGLVFPKRWRNTAIETALIVRGLWRLGRSKQVPTREP